MGEFNQPLLLRRCWEHLPVAKRPVIAASRARPAGSNIGAPENHSQHVDENCPREPRRGSGRRPLAIRIDHRWKRCQPFCFNRSTPIHTLNHNLVLNMRLKAGGLNSLPAPTGQAAYGNHRLIKMHISCLNHERRCSPAAPSKRTINSAAYSVVRFGISLASTIVCRKANWFATSGGGRPGYFSCCETVN